MYLQLSLAHPWTHIQFPALARRKSCALPGVVPKTKKAKVMVSTRVSLLAALGESLVNVAMGRGLQVKGTCQQGSRVTLDRSLQLGIDVLESPCPALVSRGRLRTCDRAAPSPSEVSPRHRTLLHGP